MICGAESWDNCWKLESSRWKRLVLFKSIEITPFVLLMVEKTDEKVSGVSPWGKEWIRFSWFFINWLEAITWEIFCRVSETFFEREVFQEVKCSWIHWCKMRVFGVHRASFWKYSRVYHKWRENAKLAHVFNLSLEMREEWFKVEYELLSFIYDYFLNILEVRENSIESLISKTLKSILP